jgi:hypothetical protein
MNCIIEHELYFYKGAPSSDYNVSMIYSFDHRPRKVIPIINYEYDIDYITNFFSKCSRQDIVTLLTGGIKTPESYRAVIDFISNKLELSRGETSHRHTISTNIEDTEGEWTIENIYDLIINVLQFISCQMLLLGGENHELTMENNYAIIKIYGIKLST